VSAAITSPSVLTDLRFALLDLGVELIPGTVTAERKSRSVVRVTAFEACSPDLRTFDLIDGSQVRCVVSVEEAVRRLLDAALDGDRLVLVGDRPKRLWAGLGNRAGLHSFAGELLRERWEKGSERLRRKIEALPPGSQIEVYEYRNVTRNRGRWVRVRVFSIEASGGAS
jgi:hypothetical protein